MNFFDNHKLEHESWMEELKRNEAYWKSIPKYHKEEPIKVNRFYVLIAIAVIGFAVLAVVDIIRVFSLGA